MLWIYCLFSKNHALAAHILWMKINCKEKCKILMFLVAHLTFQIITVNWGVIFTDSEINKNVWKQRKAWSTVSFLGSYLFYNITHKLQVNVHRLTQSCEWKTPKAKVENSLLIRANHGLIWISLLDLKIICCMKMRIIPHQKKNWYI